MLRPAKSALRGAHLLGGVDLKLNTPMGLLFRKDCVIFVVSLYRLCGFLRGFLGHAFDLLLCCYLGDCFIPQFCRFLMFNLFWHVQSLLVSQSLVFLWISGQFCSSHANQLECGTYRKLDEETLSKMQTPQGR